MGGMLMGKDERSVEVAGVRTGDQFQDFLEKILSYNK